MAQFTTLQQHESVGITVLVVSVARLAWRLVKSVPPKQAYPASKLAAKKELGDGGLTWAVLRFSFVYGEGNGHSKMMPKMAAQEARL